MAETGSSQAPHDVHHDLTTEHIIWAYRLFLDREPDNDTVVRQKLRAWSNTPELRAEFMTSPEFRAKNPDLAYTSDPTIVIKEIEENLRLFIDLSDYVIGLNILRGSYERSELDLVRKVVHSGQTVLDIGANIGLFSMIMAARVGPGGHVYAFEPMPMNADLLEHSIAENRFTERVTLERAAVGAESGEIQMIMPDYRLTSGGAHVYTSTMEQHAHHTLSTVPLLHLDSYNLRQPVSFIKIDVEGAEPLVFRGAENLLRADRPIILSELQGQQMQKVSNCTATRFLEDMRARGYVCYPLENGVLAPPIQDSPEDTLSSVVFLPHEKPELAHTITMVQQQGQAIETLQSTIAQREAYIHSLEQHTRWLEQQAHEARRTVHALEQGRFLRLMRWLHTLRQRLPFGNRLLLP
jgi:FkbM family methyltransferase